MAYRLYPVRAEYLVTNGVPQHNEYGEPPYPEFDIGGSASAQGFKYVRLHFDVNSFPSAQGVEGFGFRGRLTDKTLYGQALYGRMVLGTYSPNSYGDLGLGMELGNATQANLISGELVTTPLEVDAESPINETVGSILAPLYDPGGMIRLNVGLGRRTWGSFSNLVGIEVDEAWLVLSGDPPPEDARIEDISDAVHMRASINYSQQPVPKDFKAPGPHLNLSIGTGTTFTNFKAASYKIRINVASVDSRLDIESMSGYLYGYFYTPEGERYTQDAYLQDDGDGLYFLLEGQVAGGEYVDVYNLYFYMSISDGSGGTDVYRVELDSLEMNISGDSPPSIVQPPQPEFVVEKDRAMLDDPPEWWEHTPENGHIGYLINLGDDVSGSKPMQHLVTLDVPGVRVVEGTIANHGLVIAVADHYQGTSPVYTLPVPGASSTIKYDDSPKMTYRWRSKMFVFPGRTTLAAAKVVTCGCGDLIFRLYERGREVFATYVCNSEPFRLPPNIVGVEFQVELQGTAEVHEVHVASSMRELIEEG